jgi:acyl-CoA reductase-like NAD-dependent aldehyde dehydrogenase
MRTLASFDLPEKKIDDGDKEIITRYTPLGVVIGIVPWNYPILLACGKIAGAVLTGNTIIMKPSPFTPAGDLKLCELAHSSLRELYSVFRVMIIWSLGSLSILSQLRLASWFFSYRETRDGICEQDT